MNRRGFLTGMAGILAAGYSASVLPSGVIMPIRQLWTPLIGIAVPLSAIRDVTYLRVTKTATMAHRLDGWVTIDLSAPRAPSPNEPIAFRASIADGESIHYEHGMGWYVIDAEGALKNRLQPQ